MSVVYVVTSSSLGPEEVSGTMGYLPCAAHLETPAFPPFPDQMYLSWEIKGLLLECRNIDANEALVLHGAF